MIVVKLFVISVLFVFVAANSSEYCKICPNHTLCEYPVPGPGYACTGYDASALLTRDDIINIVSRVNERRNFVALGFSKLLPKAANMRKMSWSEDLAWSAQRWVDQCDAAVQPDRHDRCRNLEDTLVGQNIATIFGPSPGLNVKSFVDIWFMQTMEYSGSVSYYNESQDANTKYLTQLIWAESDLIGCGKARFYIEYMVVERLVCNFASSGNIHGKPVYAIGIPATQCPDNWRPDETYTGLCKQQSLDSFNLLQNPSNSLLRVVNLSRNSTKEEMVPTESDFIIDGEENDVHRHHKSRHVVNNSQADLSPFLQRPMMWNSFNETKNYLIHHYQPESGQPRVYHGHNHREKLVPPYTANNQQNFRRFYVMTQPSLPLLETPTENFRRFNQPNQCTRHSQIVNCNSPVPCASDRCTRGQSHGCGATPPCISNARKPHVYPHDDCPCSLPSTCSPPTSTSPCCEVTCPCPCHATLSPCCPHIARAQNPISRDKTRKSDDLHYYDLLPNLALRAGDTTSEKPPTKSTTPNDRKVWLLRNIPHTTGKNKVFKHKRREYLFPKNYDQVKHDLDLPDYMEEERDYINSSFDSRGRRKRKPEGKTTYKPLWNMDESDNEHSMIMKSLQYTTLRNRKIKHTWRTAHNSVTGETTTEPITIEVKKHEVKDNQGHVDPQHSTDKYLSFEELMRLRKLNGIGEFNARRSGGRQTPGHGKPISSLPPSESGVSSGSDKQTPSHKSNTLQSEKSKLKLKGSALRRENDSEKPPKDYNIQVTPTLAKHCTRKLTCTWTIAMQTNKDGSINNNPIVLPGGGSRTPPGYVEGCTRTSTCTRDFMNRNKISTLPMSTLSPGEEIEDEDYCERRSLDVKKRNSNENQNIAHPVKHHKIHDELSVVGTKNYSGAVQDIRVKRNDVNEEMLKADHSLCKNPEMQFRNPKMSYGDLYYLVLNKLTKAWEKDKKNKKHRKCSCNISDRLWNSKFFIIILVLQIVLNVSN